MKLNDKVMVIPSFSTPAVVGIVVKDLKNAVDVEFPAGDNKTVVARMGRLSGKPYGMTGQAELRYLAPGLDVAEEVEKYNLRLEAKQLARRVEMEKREADHQKRIAAATRIFNQCHTSTIPTAVGTLYLVNFGGNGAVEPFAITVMRDGETFRAGEYGWSVVSYTGRSKGGSGSRTAGSWREAAIEYIGTWFSVQIEESWAVDEG
jgi:hypothetical protein